jgi:tetratricopeptide (TPR) repeat protein
MTNLQGQLKKSGGTVEARRLAELARAAGLGDSPDAALEWHREALSLLGDDEITPLLADVLRWQGSVLRDRGRTSDAEPLYQRSLDISIRLDYESGHAHALNCLGSLAQRRGDIIAAANLLTTALALADNCGETRLVGMIQQNLGILADIRGNPAAAEAHYLVSLRTFEATNDLQPMCWVLNNLGYLYMKEGRLEEARESYERALNIARARGDLMAEGILEQNRAELLLIVGAVELAIQPIQRSLDIAEQRQDSVRRAAGLKLRGAYERMSGRPQQAVSTLGHALTLSAVGEDALLGAETLYQFGLARREAGDAAGGTEALKAALEAFERIAARQWVGRVRQRLSDGASGRYF